MYSILAVEIGLFFYLSSLPQYWDAFNGISSVRRMPLSALTVPLGHGIRPNSRNGGGSLARAFLSRRVGSMRNADSEEKEDWLETKFKSVSGKTEGGERVVYMNGMCANGRHKRA